MRRSPDPTENELRYPRIPKAPRLPRLYAWVPQDDEQTTRDAVPPDHSWTEAARSCAAAALAGMAAVLLGG